MFLYLITTFTLIYHFYLPVAASQLLAKDISVSNDIPPGFTAIKTAPGVNLYQHIDKRDYVQAVDLDAGACIYLFDNRHVTGFDTQGAYGTNISAIIEFQSIQTHWDDFVRSHGKRAFSVTNGQFFSVRSQQLAFPVKADGIIYSGGYAGDSEFAGAKMMLTVSKNYANLVPFPENDYPENPLFSSVPNMIVGLAEDADKGFDRQVGRTFIGVKDGDKNGTNETVLIFTSSRASQSHAAEVLREFGSSAVMMLDGGGSTQAIVQGREYVNSSDEPDRKIPHTIGVISGF
ncbi:MAG: phosphodiester glycosidase family protein [Hormoscilla sp.]